MNISVAFLGLLFVVATLSTTSPFAEPRKQNLSKFLYSKPVGVSASFDCAAKKAAVEYAQPFRSPEEIKHVYDGLQLDVCGIVFEEILSKHEGFHKAQKVYETLKAQLKGSPMFYVSPKGSDSNKGTRDSPFKTIPHALGITRAITSGPKSVVLLEGIYYLEQELVLSTADNHLSIVGEPGKEVVISGGIPLNIPAWKPYKVDTDETVQLFQGFNNVYGRIATPGSNTTTIRYEETPLLCLLRSYLGNFSSLQACQAACIAATKKEDKCYAFTFFEPHSDKWGGGCYSDITVVWGPQQQAGVTTGRISRMNVWVADLSHQKLKSIDGLKVKGDRAWRGRYPNSDPETIFYPDGWISRVSKWLQPLNTTSAATITVNTPNRNDIATEFQKFTIGGPCSVFDPPESYWCSDQNSGGGAATTSGLIYEPWTFLGKAFTSLKGAIVHAFHWAHWALWMFEVDHYDPSHNTISWTKGGFQGARGAAGRGGSDWYIENFLEEVDSEREYFYDKVSKKLYYFNNGTGAPSLSTPFVASNLKQLISVYASQEAPVKDITISGIRFHETSYTYMDKHGIPSGGDWAMHRGAALFFEGTERLRIHNCTFFGLDGNAVMLSGYHRDATIRRSSFEWLGENGVVLWGRTQGIDGTDGNQPRGTTISENIFRELGVWEKQSSPFFQAKSCQTVLKRNIAFNGPRALINFNDGFGGGNEITENLLFNPNRETSDQGPFNSWDRQPFLTEVRNGTPSLVPQWNLIHKNFMICNYGSNLCIDNDDGSAYYKNYHNFHIYGGHKSDFGGHSKLTYNTLNAYSQVYENGLCSDFDSVWLSGYGDGYFNNTCIQSVNVPYMSIPNCDPTKIDPKTLPQVHDNIVYNSFSQLSIKCGSKILTEKDFQSLGFDPRTKYAGPVPSDEWIIQRGKELLKF